MAFKCIALLLIVSYACEIAAWGNGQLLADQFAGTRTRPVIVGHRGSPFAFPEHTAGSYKEAVLSGADFIECDVCLTKDLVPVCRHEPWLGPTTNVMSTPLKSKVNTYLVDGYNITDVFTVDLTLAELKTLRCRQKDSFRPSQFDGLYDIMTLEEHIQLAQSAPRTVGIYPEFKHPTFFNSLPIVKNAKTTFMDIVINLLKKYGYEGPYNSPAWRKKPVFIQSFEQEDLIYASQRTCIPLVQLLDSPGFVTPDRNKTYAEMVSDKSLDEIATYASGCGPWKNMLAAQDPTTNKMVSTGLTKKIQARGMQIHLYTLRPEPQYIPSSLKNTTVWGELDYYLKTEGVDGGFTDAAPLYQAYLNSQWVNNYTWPATAIKRWNARPTTCKRSNVATKYDKMSKP